MREFLAIPTLTHNSNNTSLELCVGKNYCLFFASKMAFIYVFQVILGNILLYYIDAKCHFYVVGMYLVHDMQEYSSCWATVFETEIEFSQHTTAST